MRIILQSQRVKINVITLNKNGKTMIPRIEFHTVTVEQLGIVLYVILQPIVIDRNT